MRDLSTALKNEMPRLAKNFYCCNYECFKKLQLKKFHERVEKCRKDVEVSKVKYEQALIELNAYNAKYVEDMTEVYNRTQEFEEKRLKFFKKVLYDLHSCLDQTQNRRFVFRI